MPGEIRKSDRLGKLLPTHCLQDHNPPLQKSVFAQESHQCIIDFTYCIYLIIGGLVQHDLSAICNLDSADLFFS